MASILRRALPAVVLAGTGGVVLAQFDHTEPLSLNTIGALPPATAAGASATPTTRAPTQTAPTTTFASVAPRELNRAPATLAPATSTPALCSGAETMGPVVETRWGPVQVAAIVVNGKLCEVRAAVVPIENPRSASINSRAVPILRERALAAQAATFDTVSGATTTSLGYKSSLQALLNATK